MATLIADPVGGPAETVTLSAAQTGNGASTHVVDRGQATGPALLRITTTVGAIPTCTYQVEGSPDATSWFPVAYADSATPVTVVASTFLITAALSAFKILPAGMPWRYLRVSYTLNTNVTNTVDVWIF